jgi:hypothetical protein
VRTGFGSESPSWSSVNDARVAPGHLPEGVMTKKKGIPDDDFGPIPDDEVDKYDDEEEEDELFDDDLEDDDLDDEDDDEDFDDEFEEEEYDEDDDDLDAMDEENDDR